jgi:putative addiction module component (TIGR02574 family)
VTKTARELLKRALALSHEDRDAIVKELNISLDEDEDADPAEIERAWATEIERRLRDLDEGRVKTIPAEKAFEEARAMLDARRKSRASSTPTARRAKKRRAR